MNSQSIESDPERWARVVELFDAASILEGSERIEYLDEACIDDRPLRDYVLGLLNVDLAIEADIEQTIVNTMALAFDDEAQRPDEFQGEMIGRYRVRRLLGSGGMGMVYLAERADEQFDQQVAIKLGRHRLVDPQVEMRLRNERQILADLDHPNIARLFDGGTTKDGVPYLVMEYIDGVRIDSYCDRNRLDIAARLKLFQTICAAVHYAHENLVIHRDIKASNILVTSDGTPKLLDFGIAKLIDAQGTATDGLTREGAVIMTPSSAAPEQLLGKPITTATDTYALGILLYQLLAGVRALPTEDATPSEAARIICQSDIVRPSLQLERARRELRHDPDSLAALDEIADDRATTLDRLQRRLRGDLDTIILNASRKEPERRYRSASAFSDDIDLHLTSRPIVARADSWRYRTGKFVRRHYAAVSTSALVVLMLVTFTVLLSIQNRNIVRERDTAREVSDFLERAFDTADPEKNYGRDVSAKEILDNSADRISTSLNDRPEIQAALMGTIGRVYESLGDLQPSRDMLEQALALRRQTLGDSHPAVAAAGNDLAETLTRMADYQQAKELLEEALEINEEEYGRASPEVALNLRNLANLHIKTGDLETAMTFAESSVDTYTTLDNEENSIFFARAMTTLSHVHQLRGNLDIAEVPLREAIEIVRASDERHPDIAFHLQNLSVLQLSKGELAAAEKTLSQAVAAARRSYGDEHFLVAALLEDQGTLLRRQGDNENAEIAFREALALYVESLGADHPMVGYNMTALGMLLHDISDLDAAEQMLRRALEIYDTTPESNEQHTASALTELGAVLNATGRLAEAESLLTMALATRERDYPSDHPLVAATRTEYADTLTRLGLYDEAEPLLLQSVEALRDTGGRRQQRANEALQRLRDLRTQSPAE